MMKVLLTGSNGQLGYDFQNLFDKLEVEYYATDYNELDITNDNKLEKFFNENTPLDPRSPYSASKASADLLVMAYIRTFGLPATISRCSNNYGPYQFPEKLIPLIIKNILEGKNLPVYGDGKQVRDWLYVEDHCKGIDMVINGGKLGEAYNIGGFNEETNIRGY